MYKFYYILPSILVVLSFGPYVLSGIGIRVEHLFIYPLTVAFVLYQLINRNDKIYKESFIITFMWFLLLLVMTARTLLDPNNSLSGALAGIESVLLPLAVLVLLSGKAYNLSFKDSQQRMIMLSKTLVVMLVLNTLWILTGMFIDLTFINQYFWGSTETVATRAASNARYSGIFNQPMESGVMYSLGLLSWLYIVEKSSRVKLKHFILLVLIFVGGFMSVSKVFIFGGVVLFFAGILLSKKIIRRPVRLIFGLLVVSVPAYVYLSNNWSGMNRLLGYFSTDRFSLSLLTAGRFGGGSQQSQLFTSVWESNPLLGLGFGNNSVYDSAYFYFFANGGLLTLTLYILFLMMIAFVSIKYIKVNRFGAESRMFLLIVVLIVGSGIGAPVLTLNRVSTVIWVFIGLLLQHYHIKFKPDEVTEQVPVRRKRRFKRYRIVWSK